MPQLSDRTRAVATAALIAATLAGCSDLYFDRRETVSFAAGDSLASAQAVHTVDPWPPASANRHVEGNGVRVAGAIERYRTGQIIQPKGTGTSSVNYGGPVVLGQGGGGPSGGAPTK